MRTELPVVPFPAAARESLRDSQLRRNLHKVTHAIRDKRVALTDELPDWEALRAAGSAIKRRTMRHLDERLLELEASVTAAGGTVHWARDATEANRIVADLVAATGATRVVKVKSMTTDEIRLNDALERAGVEALETDLAELIIQLADEPSSHILVPAIHKNRSEIRDLFRRTLGADALPDGELSDDPAELAAAARRFLRAHFLSASVGISGANFAVAETGHVCVVESEGNGRMCTTLPDTLITVMGIEKVVPSWRDMEVFLQLLPRSSTGERMNPYTSLWSGTTEGDGPQDFHLVLLDNGRTDVLRDEVGREALHCIRCSACLNVCPVYERTGGHAYRSVYPGPIGAILTPQLKGLDAHGSLPYASTLCGACLEACPVEIDIPKILVHLRGTVVERKTGVLDKLHPEALALRAAARIFADASRYERAQALAARAQTPFVRDGVIGWLPPPASGWSAVRDTKAIPRQSFRRWWRENRGAREVQDVPSGPKVAGDPAGATDPNAEPSARRPRRDSKPEDGVA